MHRSSRRAVLAAFATVGVAGCLGTDDEPETTPGHSPTPEESPTPATPTPESSDDSMPEEETPTSSENETPTPPEEEGRTTPEEDGETPTPPDGAEDDEVFPGYEMTTVAVRTPGGELLGWVRAAIADTQQLRYTGLSDTDSLPDHYGMLFVYDEVDDRTFVMREMDFGIDIVYADDEGVITEIHHAPEPGPGEDGSEQRYPGRGQYVLEVNSGWTTDRGVEVGHILDV